MAKREISSNLRNLKFMQRAAQREEKAKKLVEEVHDGKFFPPGTIRKCVVIMEGNPHPGAVLGRMSFGSFNPSVDKLHEGAADLSQPVASKSRDTDEGESLREMASPMEEAECSDACNPKFGENGEHKRKLYEAVTDSESEDNLPPVTQGGKQSQGGKESAPRSAKRYFKHPKPEHVDWSVLRPKGQNKKV